MQPLSIGALLGEPGGGTPLLVMLKDMKVSLEMGIALHRGPIGKPGGGSLTRDFEREMEEVSGNGASLSV